VHCAFDSLNSGLATETFQRHARKTLSGGDPPTATVEAIADTLEKKPASLCRCSTPISGSLHDICLLPICPGRSPIPIYSAGEIKPERTDTPKLQPRTQRLWRRRRSHQGNKGLPRRLIIEIRLVCQQQIRQLQLIDKGLMGGITGICELSRIHQPERRPQLEQFVKR